LHVGFTKYKRPYLYRSRNVYSQRYSNNTYSEGTNSLYTRSAGSGTFTDRDTELAVVESGRWHNNEIKGIGPSLQIATRLKDIVDFEELVLPVKIHFQRDTVNAEHLSGRYLTTDFIGNRSFEVDASGNKIWSDGLTYLQYIPGPAIYNTEYVEIGRTQYLNGPKGEGGTVFLGSEVGEDATYVKLISSFSHYGPGTYISVVANPTQVNNSRLTERDTELLSTYAGRDQLGFGLPLTLEPELFSARTDYVLPVKVIYTKEQKAVLEADISDFFIDLKVINYGTRYLFPGTGYGYYLPYAEVDTAFIEEQAAKFLGMAPFLEGLLSTVEVLPAKAVSPEQELFTASADIEGKNIFIRPKEVSYVPVYDNRNSPLPSRHVETYTEFTAGLSTENSKDTVKTINEYINTAITSDAFRPVFSFDLFKVSDTEAIEVQKSTTEELLSTISDFYRKVSYKRDYQVETALADDTFSAFSQNYSSGYFSQAYVGETIIGD